MSEPLRILLTDPMVYALLVVAGGALHFYLRRRIAAGVDHRFDLRVEDHKQSLRLAAQAARYEYEQRLSQANLYMTNSHAAAVEVYRALRIAHGACVNLRGARQALTFEEFNKDDLAAYMASKEVPRGKQGEILERLDSDREGAIREMRAYLQMLEVQEAERQLAEAKNGSYLNELYFDDEVISAVNRFFTIMDTWMAYIHVPPDAHERRNVPTKQQMQDALEAVHAIMRERLRAKNGDAA